MTKLITALLLALLSTLVVCAQQKSVTPPQQVVIDTAAIYDSLEKELAGFLEQPDSESSLEISMGISNQVFSLNNSFLNSTQENNNIVYRPSLTYYHKSGFSLGVTAYATRFNQFTFYQYGISPGFDLQGSKSINLSVTYTHYFGNGDSIIKQSAPYENEIFASIGLKKGWLKPGLNIGWAGGKFQRSQYIDSIFLPRRGRREAVKKWVNFDNVLSDFSFSATLSHEFRFKKLLTAKDDFSFEPTLMLNAGQFGQTSTATIQSEQVRNILNKRNIKNGRTYSSNLELQSASLMLNADYYIGSFTISPMWLIDYYLHQTSSSRFNHIFSINLSYSF